MSDAQTTSIYLFDLGNTRLKFAPLHADGSVGEVVAVAHDGDALPAGWNTALPVRFEAAYVASVASPAVRVALLDGLSAHCSRVSLARTQPAFAGLRVAYADPSTLGVDRFLAMLGARARNPTGPSLVIGVGTAITIDLIDAAGLHRGGRIAPSPALMRESLHTRATQLPESGGEYRDFADNTLDALRSGCDGAAMALIRQAQDDAEALLGIASRLVLHGGGASALFADEDIAQALVLEGLASYARTLDEGADTMTAC